MSSIVRSACKGLVLAGGKSTRMGSDKALLDYHGMEQWQWCAELLAGFCSEVYVSKQASQHWPVSRPWNSMYDTEKDAGPLHPWSQLHVCEPEAHWIILACDLPLISRTAIKRLLEALDKSGSQAIASAFANPIDGISDPQACILSPDATRAAYTAYRTGMRGPRRLLEAINTTLISPDNPDWLFSANTPEEFNTAKRILYP